MNKEEALKKITEGVGDFTVFTEAEYEEYLKNFKQTDQFRNAISKEIGNVHQKYDDDLFEIFGERKPNGTRTFDFLKSKYEDLVGKADELTELNTQLKQAVEDKSGNDEAMNLLRKDLEKVKKTHQEKLEEWKTEREKMSKAQVDMQVGNALDQALIGFKFKTDIPEDARNAMINVVKHDVTHKAKFIDNKLVFVDENDEVLRDETLRPLTAQILLETRLKSIIDPGRKASGLDFNDDDDDKDKGINLNMPDSVKTNADLTDFLKAKGLRSGTPEYIAAYAKYRDKVKIVT